MKYSVLWLGPLAALLLTSSADGQTFGATERLTNTVLDPRDVFSGDLDGDGDLEPIALSGHDGQISYWDNRGGGNFGPQISLPSVEPGVDVGVSGDVDGNGTVDLIVGTDAGVVAAFLNDGSGGWTRVQVTQVVGVVELACEDLNVDGIDDVVLLSDTGAIEWFAGAQGSIPLAQGLIGQSNMPWLELLDLDGDSDPDVMLSSDTEIHYMENNGGGTFTARSVVIFPGGQSRRGHLVDIDGDGIPDIVRHLGQQLTWDRGLPGGGFAFLNDLLASINFVQFQEVLRVTPDLDGDGNPELWVASDGLGSAVEVFPITGIAPPPFLMSDPTYPFESDAYWDLGGYADFFGSAAAEFGRVSELMVIEDLVNGGDKTLADWAGARASIESFDLNSDGRRDILAAGTRRGEFALFLGFGNQQFARRRLIGFDLGPVDAGCDPTLIDADLDGDLDIAFPVSSSQFGWLERDGASFIDYHLEGLPGGQPANGQSDLKAVDLDGDGDKDVLYSSNLDVSWFQCFGVAFGPQQILTGGTNAIAHDLDEDGIQDIIIGSAWMEGVGAGGFLPPASFGPSVGGATIAFADVSGDGRADLLASGSDLAWFQNFGGLFFGPRQVIDATPGVRFETGDLDGDGDVDLVTSQGAGATWYENLGGVYGPANEIPGLAFAGQGGLALRDVDGDGDLDGLLTSDLDVGWFENLLPPPTEIGSIYCSPGVNNSTGLPGRMRADGSATVADQDVTISALDLPTSSFGFFITSRQAGFAFPVSNSEGALCVTGSIGRYVGPGQIQNSGTAGEFSLALDLNAVPSPTGFLSVAPGDTWHFQAWHRDASGGQTTSNFTDAVAVTFQ